MLWAALKGLMWFVTMGEIIYCLVEIRFAFRREQAVGRSASLFGELDCFKCYSFRVLELSLRIDVFVKEMIGEMNTVSMIFVFNNLILIRFLYYILETWIRT